MFEYIQDKGLRSELREYCESKILKLQILLKDYFTFSFKLIGSGESRLMMVNGKDNSIDLDYNLVIQRDKKDLIKKPKTIKDLFMKNFKTACGKDVKVSDSTSAITCYVGEVSNYSFSFDVGIFFEANNGSFYKIVNDKSSIPSRYIWNEVKKSKDYEMKFRSLKQLGHWEDIKDLYRKKKNDNLRSQSDKSSFSIFLETLNELIQKYRVEI